MQASQPGSSSPATDPVRQRQQRRGLQLLPSAGAPGQAACRWGAAKRCGHMPVLQVGSAKHALLVCCRHLSLLPTMQSSEPDVAVSQGTFGQHSESEGVLLQGLPAWESQLHVAAGQRKLQEAGLLQQLVTGLKQCATAPPLSDELLCMQQALEDCLLEQSTTPLGAYAVSQSRLALHMCARRCARQLDCPTPAQASSLAMQG